METRQETIMEELSKLALPGDTRLDITCEDEDDGSINLVLSVRGYPVTPSEWFPSGVISEALEILLRLLAGNISMQKFRDKFRFNVSEFTVDYGGLEISVLELLPVPVRNILRWGSNISMQKTDYLKTVGEKLKYRCHENLVEEVRTRVHNIENAVELFREFDSGGRTHNIEEFNIQLSIHLEDVHDSRTINPEDIRLSISTNVTDKKAKYYLSTEFEKWNVKVI